MHKTFSCKPQHIRSCYLAVQAVRYRNSPGALRGMSTLAEHVHYLKCIGATCRACIRAFMSTMPQWGMMSSMSHCLLHAILQTHLTCEQPSKSAANARPLAAGFMFFCMCLPT
jgi:hypothetical protein